LAPIFGSYRIYNLTVAKMVSQETMIRLKTTDPALFDISIRHESMPITAAAGVDRWFDREGIK
jgi:hypothetical protein